MRWQTAALAGVVAFWLSSALGADKFVVGEWQGQARFANNGQFSRCTLEGQYRSGITVDFGLTRDYEVEIWLHNPDWRLAKGKTYDVEYWVDNYPHAFANFYSYGGGLGRIDVSNASRVFEQLRAGTRLFVSGISRTEIFRLDNTFVGLARLAQCVATELEAELDRGGGGNAGLSQRDRSSDDDWPGGGRSRGGGGIASSGGGRSGGQSADPVGGSISGDRSSPGGTAGNGGTGGTRNTDNRTTSAAQFMALVFKSPALAKFRILSGRAIPAPLQTEQVVWQGPDALGFANRLPAGDPLQAINQRIEKDKKACGNGEFDSGGRSMKLPNGGLAYRYATECRSAEDFFTRYTAYPASDGSWYLIANLGVESPDGAAEADETIFRVIVSALRG